MGRMRASTGGDIRAQRYSAAYELGLRLVSGQLAAERLRLPANQSERHFKSEQARAFARHHLRTFIASVGEDGRRV